MNQHCGFKMTLVNVLDPQRQYEGLRLCVSRPSDGHGGSSTGSAKSKAFAFQGRCFLVALGWTTADLSIRAVARFDSSQGRHQKAPSVLRAGIDAANGPAWAAPTEHRWSRRSPVLIPHAPSSESKRRYTEAPQGDKTRPSCFRVPVAAAVAREDGPPWFSSAQVGHGWRTDLRKLLSGARSSGKGSVRSPVVGWSNGIGIARPKESWGRSPANAAE